MNKQLVYDVPLRLFHWLFAALFLAAFIIAKTIEDDSPAFSFHMMFGLTLGFVSILRIIWLFIGTRHAQILNFELNPVSLVDYFRGILFGSSRRWAGHNPASSWAALLMILLSLGLSITGYLMSTGQKEEYEDFHEIFANSFIIVVILHVAGVLVHMIRHRDMIALSMINGKKSDVPFEQSINSSRRVVGYLFIALVAAFSFNLYKNYNGQTRQLNFFGTVMSLGESESEENEDTSDLEKHNSINDYKSEMENEEADEE